MVSEVELATLDVRYESYRLRQRVVEARLLASIAERGIAEPLEGVDLGPCHVLLNGFKRLRCARKLGLSSAPYVSLGADEALGIVALLRASNDRALSLLEQAGFVDELKRLHQMNVAQIAEVLSCSKEVLRRSLDGGATWEPPKIVADGGEKPAHNATAIADREKGWVSMRLGLLAEMPELVRQQLFAGAFPVYAYMYTVRPFMRMNKVKPGEVEAFVRALSGKGLSVRDIEHLAHGYFRGSEALREQIRAGNVALPLEQLKRSCQAADGCTAFEQAMLKDLEIVQKYLQRVSAKSHDPRLSTPAFQAQAHLLLGGLLSRSPAFFQSVRQLHDRCGQA